MKFVCLIFLIALCVIVKGAPSSSLVDAMKEEMKELAMTAPAQAFITNLQSTGTYNSKVIAPADLLNTLTLWKLTGDAITKFQAAVFASKMTFETFHFVVGPTSAQLNEFVGCAKNNGATIEIAYMSVSATGTLQTQYNTVTTRHCKRCHLVKKCCHDDHTQVARGFSTAELANIEQALRASAYAKLVQELANPPTVFSVVETKLSRFIGSKASTSPADELLEKAIEALMKKFPELKKYLATNTTSTLMKEIIGRGYTTFEESASLQRINGVKESDLSAFLKLLGSEIQVPAEYQNDLTFVLDDIAFEDSNTWVAYKLAFALKGGNCKYVCILARHDTSSNSFDFLIADIQSSFTLAPDVFVIRQTKSHMGGLFSSYNDKIVLIPRALTMEDLEELFDFFEIIAFQRFAEMLKINPSAVNLISDPAPTGDSMVSSLINGVIAKWPALVDALKSSSSSEIMQRIEGRGFSYFMESAQIQKINGMVDEHLPFFMDELRDRLHVPDANKKDFNYVLGDLPYEDSSTWVVFSVVFSLNAGGDAKLVTLMARHDQANKKCDFLLGDIQATFKLAPDVFIIRKAKSYLGGMWSSSSDVLKEVPRGLTEEDLQMVFDFFEVVAFKRFADIMGLNPPMPPSPTNSTLLN